MARAQYYYIKHPLIGETTLEYDPDRKHFVDLNNKVNLRCLPTNHCLLFKLEPANYQPAPGVDSPAITKLFANRKLSVFQQSHELIFFEIETDYRRQDRTG